MKSSSKLSELTQVPVQPHFGDETALQLSQRWQRNLDEFRKL